jgi:hypothetical protein
VSDPCPVTSNIPSILLWKGDVCAIAQYMRQSTKLAEELPRTPYRRSSGIALCAGRMGRGVLEGNVAPRLTFANHKLLQGSREVPDPRLR